MRRTGVRGLWCGLAAAAMLASPGAVWAQDACGRLASVQNQVETKAADGDDWRPSTRDEELFARDRVRTGPASRAAILYSDQTLHRINERSEVEVRPAEADAPGALRVISGKHYFSSRAPKDYGRIETPTVTAAIRGTEFVVDVDDAGVTTITMIEGVVDASNDLGSVSVTAGEAVYAEPGRAPVKRVVVRPRDAVSWSLYYPPVLGGADAERLAGMGEDGRALSRATELLSAGQVDEAAGLIEDVRGRAGSNPVALALASVVELVRDRKDEAWDLANRAVEADENSAAAALARSFAAQARFDIEEARAMAETAARLDPENAEALARAAELRLAEGDTEGARDAAERAIRRDPASSRALAVLGFVQLAELRTAAALDSFERAVDADPSLPLARLGLGIALMRTDVRSGREELQTAVLLDPENSLLRSYLAKAYYEERRIREAEKEIAAAKELDPSDPTPWLYGSIIKRTDNRPVEALADLQKAVELNDRRGVYRSRLLLDEDLAVRSADLAGTYGELGFEDLGQVAARRSADLDQSNFSSHLFLASTYRDSPQFAPAFLSETLQARIYQPVNVNAVRPDTVNESVSFNEYTSLMNRQRIRGFAGVEYGDTDTDLSEFFQDGQMCVDPQGNVGLCEDILEIGDSTPKGGDATLTFNRDRIAAAVSYETFQTDGFRVNNDVDSDAVRGFLAFAPTHRDQFQLNVIDGSRDTGDLPLRDFPGLIGLERVRTDLTNVGLGYHRIISPAADLAVSAIYNQTTQDVELPTFDPGNPFLLSTGELEGTQLEAQYVLRQRRVTWVAGAGRFDGEQRVDSEQFGGGVTSATGNDEFTNAYVYARLRGLGPVELTAGLSYEDVVAPVGLLPPRDSLIGIADLSFDDSEVSPKVGLSWFAARGTVVRATAFRRLAPAIGRLQTLEPTQVGGFNQFFDDAGGTLSTNWGIGLDQEIGKRVFAGFSVLRRDLEIPEPVCASPLPFGCAGQPAVALVERTSDDWLGAVYVNATLVNRLALSVEYAYEERDFDFTQLSNNGLREDYVETHRVRPQARFFLPMGFYAWVRGNYYDQSVDQFDDLTSPDRFTIDADFWTGDVEVGYRLPKRWGNLALRALNVTDREFVFYRSSLEEDVVPARTVILSLAFTTP